jgi:flagellar hook-basal body complex protein FliE
VSAITALPGIAGPPSSLSQSEGMRSLPPTIEAPPITPSEMAPPTASFEAALESAVATANDASNRAGQKADAVARGALDDVHGTMIAAKEAEITVHLVGSIRNKLLDAFHEIWRTSV